MLCANMLKLEELSKFEKQWSVFMKSLEFFLLHRIPVSLEWGGKNIKESVYWFQHESDESSNSNVYEVAGRLVQNHFPGEFGSERLVQKVVDTILRQTARKEGDNKGKIIIMLPTNRTLYSGP